MNTFYLYKDALNTSTLEEFEKGIELLNNVILNRNSKTDTFLRSENFWLQNCNHGYFYEIIGKLKNEYKGLVLRLFDSFSPISFEITNELELDSLYKNQCNGFNGFNFQNTEIEENRQIIDKSSFDLFKLNCANKSAYSSLKNYWDNKNTLFPNLIFCERVWEQINHLSINDDRFNLIDQKLKKLNSFTSGWINGQFDYTKLGLDNSPDTPSRISNTLLLRTFDCPGIGNRVFSLHIKWSFGREPFRMYYYPNDENHKVYIGYIGPKDDIGF